jgi:hypothetical protein
MTQKTNVVTLRSGSQEIAQYDPEKALKQIVVLEAAEKHFKRSIESKEAGGDLLEKTLNDFLKASTERMISQANYVVWRAGVVVPSQTTGGTGSNQHRKSSSGPILGPELVFHLVNTSPISPPPSSSGAWPYRP